MSLNKKLIVELSPYSLQIAVLAGDRLTVCRDFSVDAKDAIAGFVAEHQEAPVTLALLAPKNSFGRLSTEEEAGSVRSQADLLSFAAKSGGTFGATAAAVACDAVSGLAPSSDQSSHWILTGAQASAVETATEQLTALGLAPQTVSFALPAQLGAAVAALKNTPDRRVALWQLNETDSVLWLVSSAGVEKAHTLSIGFNHIFDAVQAELGLKFRTAAAKLFLNNAYEFGDLAGNIAGRLRDQLLIGLAALGTKPSALSLLNLPVHQAWFARGVAQAVDLPLWSVDVSALCTQLGVEGEAVNPQLPACTLGLLKASGSAGKTGVAWIPPLLGEQPTASSAPAKEAPAKPATAPAQAPAPAASTPAAASPAPVSTPAPAAATPVAAAAPVTPVPAAAPAKASPAPAPAAPARSATPATPPAPAAAAASPVSQAAPKPKKSPLALIAVGGLVVAGIAVAAVSFVLKDKNNAASNPTAQQPGQPVASNAAPSPAATPKEIPVPATTVAYYRFEEGAANQVLGTKSQGNISDFTKKGGDFQVKAGKPIYSTTVPSPSIDGRSNALSAQLHHSDNVEYVLSSQAGLNNAAFQDFTVEAFVKLDDMKGWQTFIGRDAGAPEDTDRNFGLFYLQKTSDTGRPNDSFLNVFRVAIVTTERRTCEVKSLFVPQLGKWYHLAAVGDSKAGTLTLYVDGNKVGQAQGYTGLMKPKSFSPWTIGRGQYGRKPMDQMTGGIDEVRFSNAALKPEQFLKANGK